MTTVSMVVAMVPLLIATGPGAVSRFHIGLVIATGLGIGTAFTAIRGSGFLPAGFADAKRRDRGGGTRSGGPSIDAAKLRQRGFQLV